MTITPELIADLRRLEKAATQGPWEAVERGAYADFDGNSRVIIADDMRVGVIQTNGEPDCEANADLTVAARNALPALLDEVERLRKQQAEAGNYVADDDTHPEMVMFADGRIVAISHTDEEPYLVVSRKRERDMSNVLTAIGKERSEAWASIEASYQEAAALRADLTTARQRIEALEREVQTQLLDGVKP